MTRWIVLWLLLSALRAQANETADQLARAGVREFATAYQSWDGQGFAAAGELFRQATTLAPANRTNFYWLGVAEFHRMLQIQSGPPPASDKEASTSGLESALAALTLALKLDRQDAETHALLGTLYGMKIDGNLIRGARFGPRAADHLRKALEYGAHNPRVQYLLGTCQFHTAKNRAKLRETLATFLRAEALYAAEAGTPAAPLEPRWGADTCLTFIGRTYEQLGEPAKAADYFRRALARHPADHLAKAGLARVSKSK